MGFWVFPYVDLVERVESSAVSITFWPQTSQLLALDVCLRDAFA
ncbi:DUF645 family protein [Vibrio cholerae]|nr:DUF645 family protein [Vibrio cholerae]EJY5652963.1 DUF645 family protein [Vibrio cholerae]EKF9785422.1 DUF645 family protein [Vibrio cholerae]EMB2712854.1 DUF645 family protein [Vibrio cholerae]TQQ41922.1 DUF645 family protein [Vibrio cholerae]